MPVMCMHFEEAKHAFRINGVTFAKRQLRDLFPAWEVSKETFFRYLIIMPFFAETKDIADAPTKAGKYAIAKAKRIQKAVDIYDDAIPAFMLVMAEMGGIEPSQFQSIANACHDAICDCGVNKSPRNFGEENVVDLRKYQGKTIH